MSHILNLMKQYTADELGQAFDAFSVRAWPYAGDNSVGAYLDEIVNTIAELHPDEFVAMEHPIWGDVLFTTEAVEQFETVREDDHAEFY